MSKQRAVSPNPPGRIERPPSSGGRRVSLGEPVHSPNVRNPIRTPRPVWLDNRSQCPALDPHNIASPNHNAYERR